MLFLCYHWKGFPLVCPSSFSNSCITQALTPVGSPSHAVWWRQLSPIHGTDVPTMEWRLSVHLNWFWGMFVWITLDNLSLAFLAHFSSPQNTGISSTPFERGTTQKWFLPQWLSERNTHPYKENTHWPKKKKIRLCIFLEYEICGTIASAQILLKCQ